MDLKLLEELKSKFSGDVDTGEDTLMEYSHDASLFEVKPQVVVFPKSESDIVNLVEFVNKHKDENKDLSLTARGAGTGMDGGAINDSIIIAFGKYFNNTPTLKGDVATTEPGVFYRDFEKVTLAKNLIFASYPASRDLCAMGGIINNNAGGEKSLLYGKTEKYVERIKAVLSDGSVVEFKPLNDSELKEKMKLKTLEGEIYREMYKLITENYETLQNAKPQVSKNSAGYFLWNVYNKEIKVFDLTKLFTGAQGTLGLMLEADLKLVPLHKHREMAVIYVYDMNRLKEIVDVVMPLKPESFECYDDNTLKLGLKFMPEFTKQLGLVGMMQAGMAFFPAFWDMVRGCMPKLVLQVDFTGDDMEELNKKVAILHEKLKDLTPRVCDAKDNQENKYWLVRRESFNMLRKKVRNLHTAPFVDDFVVDPHDVGEVLEKVTAIFKRYPEFIFTAAGHIGDGNFHLIPLANIENPKVRKAIGEISEEVYKLVLEKKGSTTGEHNDGLVRSPYLEKMYGKQVMKLFEKTKNIFDPQNIFNPRKKIGSSWDYAMNHIRSHW